MLGEVRSFFCGELNRRKSVLIGEVHSFCVKDERLSFFLCA